MDQSKLDKSATSATWKDVSNTHIDKIKSYLDLVVKKPENYLDNLKEVSEKYYIRDIYVEELKYIINTYYNKALPEFESDINILFPKSKKNGKSKQNKKKKGLSKEDIILKNQQKQFKLNKFTFELSNKLFAFRDKLDNVCDLITICKDLYSYKLVNLGKYFLKNYGGSRNNDLDTILSNLHLWRKSYTSENFELTKCQKSIVQFILEYSKEPFKSKSLLEMSNTGSGKTVGLIIAMGILWKKILYNNCVSHAFITRNSRKHSVRFPTKIIIAILPSSVLSFVQAALTAMKIPWAYVTSTSTAILDEFNPDAVINYSNVSRKVFQHFCEAGSTAPAIYLTTETPTPENSIFNCIKAAYKTVFSLIKKHIPSYDLNLEQYISYDSTNNCLQKGKIGSQYCFYNPDSICTLIGDDMETIESFNTMKTILNPNLLSIITTATPSGLSKTLSMKTIHDRLPANTIIPPPQDEVRNTGGIKLIGSTGNINILNLAYIKLFKIYKTDDIHLKYKWRIVFESFINGIFERKYIIPLLYNICSQLKDSTKKTILNRKYFFEKNLELKIDSIACHIMRQFCKILNKNKSTELIDIISNIKNTKNQLFDTTNLQKKLIHTDNRGILLCSPAFSGNTLNDHKLIESLTDDQDIVYKELEKFNTQYQNYLSHKEKIQNQFSKFDSIDGASKLDIERMSQEQTDSIIEPNFEYKYQLFSVDHLRSLNCNDPLKYATKLPIEISQLLTAYDTQDVRLAQGVLSIDPNNSKKLETSLKNYTQGTPDNIRCVQFKTDAFNTRQLVLGANPPSKLNIVIANYELTCEYPYMIVNDGINSAKFPASSIINLLIQICGRIGRGHNAEAYNYIFTTDSIASILISTTPKTMLFDEYTNKCTSLNKIQARIRGFLTRAR